MEERNMNRCELKEFVKKYALEHLGETEEEIDEAFKDTIGIAYFIAKVTHDGQERENGAPYFIHPLSVCRVFRNIVNAEDDDFDPYELIDKYGIPFWGVQETCFLHDVMEDSNIDIEDIEKMYTDLGYGLYFRTYIKEPLQLITHDKSVDYETYMNEVLKSATASMVKLIDLNDNSNIFGLKEYGDREDERMHRYVKYKRMINDKYHFVEKLAKYRKDCFPEHHA